MMYRQGDVLLEKLSSIPNRSTTNESLLVRGEGRNHGHFIKGDDVEILIAEENELTERRLGNSISEFKVGGCT